MSFSWEVKNEICYNKAIRLQYKCEQATGLLQYATSFSESKMELDTEHKGVARLYCDFASQLAGIEGSLTLLSKKITGRLHYISSVDATEDRIRIIDALGKKPEEYTENEQTAAYLSGAFMSCGNITDPAKSYHLEFDLIDSNYMEDLISALECMGLTPKTTLRRGRRVVYFKESEQIEDLLTLMGAPKAALNIMNIKVEKSLRNRINRANNCDVANLDKTLAASQRQIENINFILEVKGFQYIPEDLRELAKLRCDNPDASLSQLGSMLSLPASRSAVNRRLVRLSEVAAEIRKSMENE